MPLRRVAPAEALTLMDEQGWVYVDVRSVQEFEAGHPAGAYNIPLLDLGPRGMEANPDFVGAVKRVFPADTGLVLGCQSGGRSLRAAAMLQDAGYEKVVDQRAGYAGHGEPGWRAAGLPVSTTAEPGRSWRELKEKA